MEQEKFLKSISKLPNRSKLLKITDDNLKFLSQIFYYFLKECFPVKGCIKSRLSSNAPVIRKMARCRSIKACRTIIKHIPLNVVSSLARWSLAVFKNAPSKHRFLQIIDETE